MNLQKRIEELFPREAREVGDEYFRVFNELKRVAQSCFATLRLSDFLCDGITCVILTV